MARAANGSTGAAAQREHPWARTAHRRAKVARRRGGGEGGCGDAHGALQRWPPTYPASFSHCSLFHLELSFSHTQNELLDVT